MGVVPIDLNMAGLIPANSYTATITGLDYQIKTGAKWNKDGTEKVDFDTWAAHEDALRRLNYEYSFTYTDKAGNAREGKLWGQYYKIGGGGGVFLRDMFKAAGVDYSDGFDPDSALNQTVGLNVAIEDNAEYGAKNIIADYFKV